MAKILVLEDEDDLRELIDEELTEVGHSAVGFSRGQEALDYLAKENVDLILSDITMPQMTGYQFFRNLREQLPQHTGTPFIFMTALSDRENEIKGLRLGVDDYITKPIDYDLMLLRVEGHLRRRQAAPPPPAPAAPAQPAAAGNGQADTPKAAAGDQDAAAKLKAILERHDGQVTASRFKTISMEEMRTRLGDRWSGIKDQFLPTVEAAVRAHLGSDDVLAVTPSYDFLVYFAEIDDDEIEPRTNQIRDEIWERLFALTQEASLSNVDAHAHELTLDPSSLDENNILGAADKAAEEEGQKEIESRKRQLEQIYSFEKMHAIPLLVANGSPSKIKALSFNKKTTDKIKALSSLSQSDGPFLLELQEQLFERFKEMPNSSKVFARSAMLLPVAFTLLRDPATRDGLTTICQGLEQSMDLILIIEIVGGPDRLKPYEAVLAPLPIGRNLQFIEIRRPQQADGVDLDGIGVAYVSMSYGDLEACPDNERGAFLDKLQQQGIKLYVKDIPDGMLLEAQRFDGKLYSTMK